MQEGGYRVGRGEQRRGVAQQACRGARIDRGNGDFTPPFVRKLGGKL